MAKSEATKALIAAPDAFQRLLDHVENGGSLRAFCRENGVALRSVQVWIASDDEMASQYARACDERANAFFEDINDLANRCVNSELDPNIARVAIDAKKWAASKLLPKVYGDKQQVDLNVTDGLSTALEAARGRAKLKE